MIAIEPVYGWPGQERSDTIFAICNAVFGQMDHSKFYSRMREKHALFTLLAVENGAIAGFKTGYDLGDGVFYSWIGGVLEAYRRQGIARMLMLEQHAWCRENGYRLIRTKTYNQWKGMLILNLQCGFDITGTAQKDNGRLQILLEKQLV
mgnify:FL=1